MLLFATQANSVSMCYKEKPSRWILMYAFTFWVKNTVFPDSVGPVLLERTEEGSTCILALCCSPSSNAAISRLLVVSEARNMEIYNQSGEYCGTARGERVTVVLSDM